jgi:HK97 gp10 family phage protein
VAKHARKLMAKDVAMLYSKIKPNIPHRTGMAQSKLRKSLTGKGVNLTGKVGWWGSNQPWYVNVLEYGAKSHKQPKHPVFKKRPHPGISKRGFMEAGFSAMKPIIETDLKTIGEAIVKEMAVR